MKILGLKYKTLKSPTTGRVWLDRNIGASQVAESSTDKLSYGHYLTNKEALAIAKLVKGFRLPTPEEFRAEELENSKDAFDNLGLSIPGNRVKTDGAVSYEGSCGFYWSGSVYGTNARNLSFDLSATYSGITNNRASGFSVRLIKDKIMKEISKESIKDQRVLIKTWKEIKKCSEKGLHARRSPDSILVFNKAMKYFCGTIVTLDARSLVDDDDIWTIAPWMVQEIIPISKEEVEEQKGVALYDKQPVYYWDDASTHWKHLGFWDGKNNRVFDSEGKRNKRNGFLFNHHEAIPDNMIPEWMIEAQKTLED